MNKDFAISNFFKQLKRHFQKPFIPTLFLLVFFSGFTYSLPIHSQQVLGVNTLKLPRSSGFQTIALNAPAPLPVKLREQTTPPIVSAKSVLIFDRASHTILFEKNARQPLPPASTTKIMTALITLENLPLEKIITVRNLAPNEGGSYMGLINSEQITVKSLLWGLLLNSGNDAAITLAKSIDQSNRNFVDLMNKKASRLHLKNTHFTNPVGFDNPNHYSSAYDLAIIADQTLKKYPLFRQIVATPKKTVFSENLNPISSKRFDHHLKSTNPLLGKTQGVRGVKTGWTENAGECLMVLIKRKSHSVLVVVLGSNDRALDTHKLIEWTFKNFTWG